MHLELSSAGMLIVSDWIGLDCLLIASRAQSVPDRGFSAGLVGAEATFFSASSIIIAVPEAAAAMAISWMVWLGQCLAGAMHVPLPSWLSRLIVSSSCRIHKIEGMARPTNERELDWMVSLSRRWCCERSRCACVHWIVVLVRDGGALLLLISCDRSHD